MPSAKNFARYVSLCLLFSLVGGQVALAQTPAETCIRIREVKDFIKISDMRDKLMESISDLEDEIDNLRAEIPEDIEAAKAELATYQKDVALINQKKQARQTRTPDPDAEPDTNTADLVNQKIVALEKQIKESDANKAKLTEKEKELSNKKAELDCLQERIRTILTPEQDFKLTMSIVFAILVGLVIVGFFVLAFVDDRVRRTIFSGEAGIQFLTLFSIVIAIILFGITGILQDKELAALLGGLSGYILGRSNTPDRKRNGAQGDPAAPPPDNPPDNPPGNPPQPPPPDA
ncbi:MAG TPA: hypothetical protein VJ842_12135 [Pyrinomonadaceae bacterium]|nr:hypothetical protein [Pyrinomonadaceae bacterium]